LFIVSYRQEKQKAEKEANSEPEKTTREPLNPDQPELVFSSQSEEFIDS